MKNKEFLSDLILEKLSEAGEIALEAMFPKNRAESAIWRKALGLPESYRFSKQTFSTTLARLKKQGLVKNTASKRWAKWFLTKRGKNELNFCKNKFVIAEDDGLPRLVVYDIPESERRKRDWIRTELVFCGYKQLQRSVWLGYRPLPINFVESLKNFGLRKKVHIVGIDKRGTLDEI